MSLFDQALLLYAHAHIHDTSLYGID